MMEKQPLITETITKQQAETPACFSRFGTIVASTNQRAVSALILMATHLTNHLPQG